MEYKDKTFCSFYITCKDGIECHRALTKDIISKAVENNYWVSQFLEKPECYKEYDKEWWKSTQIKTYDQNYCLHDRCPECHGTGKKQDETLCVHYISCGCPKCSVRY